MIIELHNYKSVLIAETNADYRGKDKAIEALTVSKDYYDSTEPIKAHRWKKAVKKYMYGDGKFLTGFLPFVVRALGTLNLKVEDKRTNKVSFKKDLNFRLGKDTLYPHQQQAVINAVRYFGKIPYFRGTVNAATRSGKTYMMGGIFQNIKGCKMLMLVTDERLINQHYKFYVSVFGSRVVGLVTSKDKPDIKPLTIAMVSTFKNRLRSGHILPRQAKAFNTVVVDESHKAGSETFVEVMKSLDPYCVYYFSGTSMLGGDVFSKNNRVSAASNTIYNLPKIKVMELGFSLKPKVIYVPVAVNKTQPKRIHYRTDLKINVWQNRNFYVSLVKILNQNIGRYIFISFKDIKNGHGRSIHEVLEKLGLSVCYIDGKTKDKETLIQDYKDGKYNVLLSSAAIREGLSIPIIETIIYVKGGKDLVDLDQVEGRGETLYDVKTQIGKAQHERNGKTFRFYDFVFEGKYTKEHSIERMNYFTQQGFKIEPFK